MKEQAILASFKDPETAQLCEKELRKLGVEEVQIDRVDAYPGNPSERITNFITGNLPSLGAVTLGTSFESRDASILASAHPDASGMAISGSGRNDTTGYDILMTVICDNVLTEQVVSMIKQAGGET